MTLTPQKWVQLEPLWYNLTQCVYASWHALWSERAGGSAEHITIPARKTRLLCNNYITKNSGPVMLRLITPENKSTIIQGTTKSCAVAKAYWLWLSTCEAICGQQKSQKHTVERKLMHDQWLHKINLNHDLHLSKIVSVH